MKILPCEDSVRLKKVVKELEPVLNVKITIKGKEVSLDGSPEDEYIAEKVIDAINFGFPLDAALSIKKEDALFDMINIKEFTHSNDMERVRARVIGTEGRTLRTLNQLTDCFFEIKGNEVGVIGLPECIKNGHDAIVLLVQGSKQANVYAFLEKHQIQPILDLGLKAPKKQKKTIKKN
jgi:ribosomal RNA assembly protein